MSPGHAKAFFTTGSIDTGLVGIIQSFRASYNNGVKWSRSRLGSAAFFSLCLFLCYTGEAQLTAPLPSTDTRTEQKLHKSLLSTCHPLVFITTFILCFSNVLATVHVIGSIGQQKMERRVMPKERKS